MKALLDYVSAMTNTKQKKGSVQDDGYYYVCLFCTAGKCR